MESGLGVQFRGMLPGMQLAAAQDLAELERHEVVDGDIVAKASPTARHSFAQGQIIGALHGLSHHGSEAEGWWILPEVTVELMLREVYQPDIAGWRMERMATLPDDFPIRVAPDWVCEILSPSTAQRDLGHKRRTYQRAHVGHYWVIDPQDRTLSVYRWQEHDYLFVLAAGVGELVRAEPFEAAEIVMADLFGR